MVPTRILFVQVEGRLDPPADVIDRGREEAPFTQQVGKQADRWVQLFLTTLRDDLVTEDVLPRKERRVRRMRRDVGADALVKAETLRREAVQVRRCEPRRVVGPQPVPAQAIDDDPDDVHALLRDILSERIRQQGAGSPPSLALWGVGHVHENAGLSKLADTRPTAGNRKQPLVQ